MKIELLNTICMPERQNEGDAGFDLRCSENFAIFPRQTKLVPCGFKIAIDSGYEGQVRPRSGLALKKKLVVLNSPGTIDSNYRGEVKVILSNFGEEPLSFFEGDRIAQLVICPIYNKELAVVDSVDETTRGSKGFGSTDENNSTQK